MLDTTSRPGGTTAAATAFCAAPIDGPGGRRLWIDGNGKITAGNGTLEEPKPNAFSLLQVADCPGSTPSCRTACYIHNLEKFAPGTHALYRHNSSEIRAILSDRALALEWRMAMADWIAANCKGGFRWHVSGDVFDEQYAKWIVGVCKRALAVRHWIYTRSFQFVPILTSASTANGGNLAINLSCDADNWEEGNRLADRHDLRVCYMTVDGQVPDMLVDGDVIFPDYALRGGTEKGAAWFATLPPRQKAMVCPVDYSGKAENRRCGPCARCLT